MRLITCPDSTSIDSFGYDFDRKVLHVFFKKSGHYKFFDVPRTRFIKMVNADSRGKYFGKFIKNIFYSDIVEN